MTTLPVAKDREDWKTLAKQQMRYNATFVTQEVAYTAEFHESAIEGIDYAVQEALVRLEQEQGCLMRYHTVFYAPVVLYHDEEQYVHFVGTILAEPIKGEIPRRGPKRKYKTA